jgi:protein SCO1/2
MRTFVVAAIAAVLGFTVVLAVGAGKRQVTPAAQVDLSAWHRLEANEPAADFTLTNQDGRRVALRDLRGKAVIMTFFFSHCTDVCPTQLNILDSLIAELAPSEREKIALVGISIDPARDTPARLKPFLAERGLDAKRWQLLTGTLTEATKAAEDYGIAARPSPFGDLVHNSVYILIDAAGIERSELHGIATPREAILKEVRALLDLPPVNTGG